MHCSQCGKQIEADSKFCRYCGAAVTASEHDQIVAPATASQQEPSSKRTLTAAGLGVGALVILGLLGSKLDQNPPSSSPLAKMEDGAGTAEPAAPIAPSPQPTAKEPPSPWSYSTDEDKVRGGTTYYARTTSTNSIFQNSPYEAQTTMTMTIRKAPGDGTNVLLIVSSGQMMCPSYEGCSGTARFDAGPAQRISFSGPADNSSEVIFVDGAKSFIGKLKKAKRVVIEKTLYQAGAPQFEFDVSGLKWDR